MQGERRAVERRARVPRRSHRLGAIALATAMLVGSGEIASALTIDDINPLFFPLEGVNTGFDPVDVQNAGLTANFTASPGDQFLCAGTGVFAPTATGVCADKEDYDLRFTQDLTTVHQNPQASGGTPTPADPFIADSLWTFTNTSGGDFEDPLLLIFTNVNLEPIPGSRFYPGAYPFDVQTGLDADLLQILKYTIGSDDYFYGVAWLGPLESGESAPPLTIRYVVNGELPIDGNDLVIPPISVLGLAVPEPTTLLLLASCLTGLAALRAGWRWR